MTLLIVDKRKQPISLYWDTFVSTDDYIVRKREIKICESEHFWYGFSGSSVYDVLFDFISDYFKKKKNPINRLSLYECIQQGLNKLDFDYKDVNGLQLNILDGFLIAKENQKHFDIVIEGNRIVEVLVNEELVDAYGYKEVALHLLDANINIEEIYKLCSERCNRVSSNFGRIQLPILQETI